MKKHSLFLISGVTLFSLISCGANGTKSRAAHKDYAGYSAKFYDYEKHGWVKLDNLTWSQSFDELITQSKKARNDKSEDGTIYANAGEIRSEYLHQCEDLVMESGAICPLYFYSDVYLQNPDMVGVYSSPVGFKYFNQCKYLNGKGGNNINVCVGSREDHVDPALNSTVDGGIICLANFEGLCGWKRPNGTEAYSEKAFVSEGIDTTYCTIEKNNVQDNGHVTYTIKLMTESGTAGDTGNCVSKWSDDGTPLTADDFIYSWSRAASGKLSSDYGYMFDCIVGYDETSSNIDKIVTLKGLKKGDNDNTFTVELISDVPYFTELLAFPTYLPVKKSVVENNNTWWTKAETYVGNGPMKCTGILNENNGYFNFVKNENYPKNYGEKASNYCNFEDGQKLVFKLSDDEENQFMGYKGGLGASGNKDYDFIDTIPQGAIDDCKGESKKYGYYCIDQIGTYYVVFNVNDSKFNNYLDSEEKYAKFRRALSYLIDRDYICTSIGKGGQKPANGFVGNGAYLYKADEQVEANKEDWKKTRGKNRDGEGYYYVKKDNETAEQYATKYKAQCDEGLAMLKELFPGKYNEKTKKFEGLPSLEYLYNSGTGHKAIGEYLYNCFAAYGIDLKLNQQEWAVFLNTRKAGDFSFARNGWLADFTDPISFLDMWITSSGNNDAQFGK